MCLTSSSRLQQEAFWGRLLGHWRIIGSTPGSDAVEVLVTTACENENYKIFNFEF